MNQAKNRGHQVTQIESTDKKTDDKISFPDKIIRDFGSLEKAVEWFQANIQSEPIDFRLNLQVILNLIGRETESFEMSNQLMMIAGDDPRVLFNRGWHMLHRGQFHEGFSLLENGRRFGGYGEQNPISPMPVLARTMNVPSHAKVLMYTEGGFGDEIINFRFVENIKKLWGLNTIVACQRQLVPLFAKHPDVAAAIDKNQVTACYHDFWIPGMSAASRLCAGQSDVSSKPYLDVTHVPNLAMWKTLIQQNTAPGKKLKVALRWSGSPLFEHQQYRKFPVNIVMDLAQNNDVQFFSVQRDNDLIDLPDHVSDLSPFLNDWADTACALSLMDLVITPCTSIAHCAGALGVPTWVITPVLPYYIWSTPGDKSPWYDSVRLFRQTHFGQWDDVGAKLQAAFKEWHQSRGARQNSKLRSA